MATRKLQQEPEPLVTTDTLIRIYGGGKTYWSEARSKLGLPHYDVGGAKHRLSEVEEWIQQRKKINGRGLK